MKFNKTFSKKTIFEDRDAKMFHHYSISIKTLCNIMVERVNNKKDNTVLITGIIGFGKSVLAGKMCFNYFEHIDNPRVPGQKMYTDDNFIVKPEDYAKRMIEDQGTVLWWDESRDGLSSKNWNKEINKLIVSRKNKNRKRGITSLVLLPYEEEVDKSFLKHVTMWIWIKERTLAWVFVSAKPRMGGHGLHIPTIIERQNKWLKENPTRKTVPATIHPEFIGCVVYGGLTNKQDDRYNYLTDKHHAVGEHTDEELAGQEMSKEETEILIPKILDQVESGEIKTKREMFEKAKEATGLPDNKVIALFNRHLGIRGLKKFNSFEI